VFTGDGVDQFYGRWEDNGGRGIDGGLTLCSAVRRASEAAHKADPLDRLVRKLDTIPMEGPSFGGPHVAVQPNEVTRAVLAEGNAAVGPLIAHLDQCTYSGAVYTVYCLRQLRAKAGRPAVERLRRAVLNRERFADSPHDLTLEVEIEFFLRDAADW